MSIDFGFEDITRIEMREGKRIVNDELDKSMTQYYNNFVIPEIMRISRASNLPEQFVNGFKFVKTSRNRGKIINTWGTPNKPLAKWFNYGTKAKIWIQPKKEGGVLAFASKGASGGRNASAIFYKSSSTPKAGATIFSKGHYISGQPKTEAMERGVESSKKVLIRNAIQQTQEKLKNHE